MDKPAKLYHASDNRNIAIFEPRNEKVRDPKEGPVVFATPDISYASCFIVKTDSSWNQISRWGKDRPWVFICSDFERFKNNDHGGSIYVLPNNSFYTDPEKGTGNSEWVSKEPVTPESKEDYASGLDAMLNHSVQIFFVTKEEFEQINNAEDHGLGLVQEWQKQNRSINQQKGINYQPA